MDSMKYSLHSASRLMDNLTDMIYDIRSEGPGGLVPEELSIMLAELDERLHRLESLEG